MHTSTITFTKEQWQAIVAALLVVRDASTSPERADELDGYADKILETIDPS